MRVGVQDGINTVLGVENSGFVSAVPSSFSLKPCMQLGVSHQP